MRLPTGSLPLIVALFTQATWSALVPVTLRQSDASLAKRDAVSVAELLRPAHDIKLQYAEGEGRGRYYSTPVADTLRRIRDRLTYPHYHLCRTRVTPICGGRTV
jgi:hypothetical protein